MRDLLPGKTVQMFYQPIWVRGQEARGHNLCKEKHVNINQM